MRLVPTALLFEHAGMSDEAVALVPSQFAVSLLMMRLIFVLIATLERACFDSTEPLLELCSLCWLVLVSLVSG